MYNSEYLAFLMYKAEPVIQSQKSPKPAALLRLGGTSVSPEKKSQDMSPKDTSNNSGNLVSYSQTYLNTTYIRRNLDCVPSPRENTEEH